MEKLYNKKSLIALLTILVALAMILSCVFFTYNGQADAFTTTTTDANYIGTKSTELGELMLEGYDTTGTGNVFDGEVFWPLVSLVTGLSNPKESDLASWSSKRTSADFRTSNSANGNLDITVTINGLPWTPTYLSYNTDGEPILTFWLATSSVTGQWNTAYQNSLGKYPSNMYGTSYMRASVLNNGGSYAATYNATSLTPITQDASSTWANYTMAKTVAGVGGKSIKEFIEVPDNMSWQHDESAKAEAGLSYDYNNDALDIGGSYSANYNYYTNATVNTDGNHTTYQAWKNDALWLTSFAEVGAGTDGQGMWKTSVFQRANSAVSWLRSAFV